MIIKNLAVDIVRRQLGTKSARVCIELRGVEGELLARRRDIRDIRAVRHRNRDALRREYAPVINGRNGLCDNSLLSDRQISRGSNIHRRVNEVVDVVHRTADLAHHALDQELRIVC